jgi:DNA polymerase-1
LIQEFGNLESLYEYIEKHKTQEPEHKQNTKNKNILTPKLIQKLFENKDMAFFSKKLATIVRDVDVDFDLAKANWLKNLKKEEVEKKFKEFGFYSLIKRLEELDVQGQDIKQKSLLEPKELTLTWIDNGKTSGHDLKPFAKKYIAENRREPELGFDIKIAAYLLRSDRKNYDPEVLYREEFDQEIESPSNAMRRLAQAFHQRLEKEDLLTVFEKIEMPLINVLAEMELRGVLIDSKAIVK